MKVYNISPGKGCNKCCEKDPKNALIWLEEAEPGETITIDVMEMSEEDFNSLPEYMGP
jgi:hypothetical protein